MVSLEMGSEVTDHSINASTDGLNCGPLFSDGEP